MAGTWKDFALQEDSVNAEDGKVHDFLMENKDFPVRIDAGNLRRIDTMLVELLLTAATEWRKCGLGFRMTRLSPDNEDVLIRLGISPDHLERSVVQ